MSFDIEEFLELKEVINKISSDWDKASKIIFGLFGYIITCVLVYLKYRSYLLNIILLLPIIIYVLYFLVRFVRSFFYMKNLKKKFCMERFLPENIAYILNMFYDTNIKCIVHNIGLTNSFDIIYKDNKDGEKFYGFSESSIRALEYLEAHEYLQCFKKKCFMISVESQKQCIPRDSDGVPHFDASYIILIYCNPRWNIQKHLNIRLGIK